MVEMDEVPFSLRRKNEGSKKQEDTTLTHLNELYNS